jgi:hypothetical protein
MIVLKEVVFKNTKKIFLAQQMRNLGSTSFLKLVNFLVQQYLFKNKKIEVIQHFGKVAIIDSPKYPVMLLFKKTRIQILFR